LKRILANGEGEEVETATIKQASPANALTSLRLTTSREQQ